MYETEIENGVEYCNERFGKSWVNNVILEILDISYKPFCIIGQLAGYDDEAICDIDKGFSLNPCDHNFKQLTSEWKQKIAYLRTLVN